MDLIFPHPQKVNEQVYIAPQYLPDKHPVEDLFKIASDKAWQSSLWLKVPMFFYKKVLNGLIFHYAKDDQTEARYFWKHGILFMKGSHRILIKGLYPDEQEKDGKIIISVEDGEGKAALEKEIFEIARQSMINLGKTENDPEGAKKLSRQKVDPAESMQYELEQAMNKRLEVSFDNCFYVNYNALLQAVENQEPRVEAQRCQSRVKEVNHEHKIIPIKPFASILPEQNLLQTKKVFLSYSHQNTHWLNRFSVHLSGLRHSKLIEDWSDKGILPGEKWDDKIKESIEKADLFILLLSADFVASKYIWEVELPAMKSKIESHGGKMVFVLMEPFDIGAVADVSQYEIIPKDKNEHLKAVSEWDNHESGLAEAAKKIRELLEINNNKIYES